jgi:TolA-binding protein
MPRRPRVLRSTLRYRQGGDDEHKAAVQSRVFDLTPKGDKAAIALYKRALALAEIGWRDEAVAQLNALVKAYPKRSESEMAKKCLQEWLQTQPKDP